MVLLALQSLLSPWSRVAPDSQSWVRPGGREHLHLNKGDWHPQSDLQQPPAGGRERAAHPDRLTRHSQVRSSAFITQHRLVTNQDVHSHQQALDSNSPGEPPHSEGERSHEHVQ